jgi:hypothetical protein
MPSWPTAEAKGGAKASTPGRRVAAIPYAHKMAGPIARYQAVDNVAHDHRPPIAAPLCGRTQRLAAVVTRPVFRCPHREASCESVRRD